MAPAVAGQRYSIIIVIVMLLNVEGHVTSPGDPVPNCIEDKMAEVNIDLIEAHEAGALAEGTGFMYIPFEIRIFNVVGTAGLS